MKEINSRYDLPILFKEMVEIKKGVELGVSHGDFAHFLLDNYESWDALYGVDEYVEKWGGDRDDKLYAKVVESLSSNDNYTLLKMKFSDAVERFPDGFFDFIFIDGHSGNGQENGKTFSDWFPKLRTGGVFSGRAYDDKYAKNIEALDCFLYDNNLGEKLKVLNESKGRDFVKNWYIIK